MFPSDYLIFLQIILFLFITPGLPRVVIVSHTLNYGLKRSVWTAIGDISANNPNCLFHIISKDSYLISPESEVLLVTGISNPSPLKLWIEHQTAYYRQMQFRDHHIFDELPKIFSNIYP